jgi:small redox-active disulfide protein 2
MKIQVLGSGCTNCKKLHELTQQAVKELNLDEEVEYVTDVSKIIEMGAISSPVLAINGKPVTVGFVPNIEKIKESIKNTRGCCADKSSCDIKCKPNEAKKKDCSCEKNC